MIFRKSQKQVKLQIVKNNGIEIEYVKNLGVIINKNLAWESHLNQVSNIMSRIIGIMNRLKFTLSQNILLDIYNFLIITHIYYCIILWSSENNRFVTTKKSSI